MQCPLAEPNDEDLAKQSEVPVKAQPHESIAELDRTLADIVKEDPAFHRLLDLLVLLEPEPRQYDDADRTGPLHPTTNRNTTVRRRNAKQQTSQSPEHLAALRQVRREHTRSRRAVLTAGQRALIQQRDRARMRRLRAEATAEEMGRRKEVERERMKRVRALNPPEKKEAIRMAERERMRVMRAGFSPEEKAAQRQVSRENMRRRRARDALALLQEAEDTQLN